MPNSLPSNAAVETYHTYGNRSMNVGFTTRKYTYYKFIHFNLEMFPDDPLPIHYSKTTGHVTVKFYFYIEKCFGKLINNIQQNNDHRVITILHIIKGIRKQV
jgi:hypothetical protein